MSYDDRKYVNAFMTVESSFIIPVILFVIMGLILSIFYFYDKNIINGTAYETAVVASMKIREDEAISVSEMENYYHERIRRKCVFLTTQKVTVVLGEDEVTVEVFARKGRFRISTVKRAAITKPEKKIRDIRRLDIKDGT